MSCDDYDRRIGGIWQKKKKILGSTDEIDILIEYYKDLELNIQKMKELEIILLIYG